ncbi:protein ANTAGONIST OF LIKE HETEROCHROMATIN PROTEIN 1-like [Oryza brachyantha]|nr:protein ANTAGONIST OF LIKE HETEROCHROMATIN PROTEIN 1-like [Oryza brachyantha]
MSDPACPEADFRRAFRMPRAVFDKLCGDLGAAVAKEDTTLRAAVPVPQRVAVCVWRLATGEPLREVSRHFGLGISTCHNIVLQVCAALTAVLLSRVVRWPDSPAAAASRFQALSGIPGVVGAVHTEHIPIVAPRENAGEYFDRRLTDRNQKATYSVAVQAVVDADGAFTDVCIGHPGSLSDAAVLEKSALHAQCEAGLLLGDDGHGQPLWLVGGASYPLTSWMLVPCTHPNLTWAHDNLNERVACARAPALRAFRRLRARWRCLQRRAKVKLSELPNMLGACCVLHNLCERSGEELDADVDLLPHDKLVDDGVITGNAGCSSAQQTDRDRMAHVVLHAGNA